MPLLAIGVIAVVLLLTWGGMEIGHVMHTWPLQFWFGVVSFLILAFAITAAQFRRAGERVPLRPRLPPLPPAIQAVPVKAELRAAPVLKAVASPEAEEARACEGPGCLNKVDDDPWTARVPGGAEHVFCSESCASGWHAARRLPR